MSDLTCNSQIWLNPNQIGNQFGTKNGPNRSIIIRKVICWTATYKFHGNGSQPSRKFKADYKRDFHTVHAYSNYIGKTLALGLLNEDFKP